MAYPADALLGSLSLEEAERLLDRLHRELRGKWGSAQWQDTHAPHACMHV
jgi:hypothetical protein